MQARLVLLLLFLRVCVSLVLISSLSIISLSFSFPLIFQSDMSIEDAFLVGSRILASLKLLVTCEGDNDYLKGSNAAALFQGTHPPFNTIAGLLLLFFFFSCQ
jgi:hypothetical protein